MAEIELSVIAKQCLNRRIADIATLVKEVAIWTENRNKKRATVDWQFSKEKARVKLKKFYDFASK